MKEDQTVLLEIHGLGSLGPGVGHQDGYAVFVDGALPGERVLARMTEVRKRHGFAELVQVLRPSPEVIYISCDPATLARDLSHLVKLGYVASAIQPFDMFPQTSHVECVVRLHRAP